MNLKIKESSKDQEEEKTVDVKGFDLELLPVMLGEFLNQIKLWHWQCDSGTAHQTLGGLYESIAGLQDRLAEVMLGYSKELRLDFEYSTLKPFTSNEECKDYLKNEIKMLNYLAKEVVQYSDLDNILAEMIECLNKNIYLLSLK